jgi:hypothetical protein
MKKALLLLSLVTATLLLNSCATLFGDHNRVVHVTSAPAGANVYVNNTLAGQTTASGVPLDIYLPSSSGFNSNVVIKVEKPGYEAIYQPVQTSMQTVAILNVFFWPGFIVDIISGDIVKISNPYMNFVLPPAGGF